MTPEKALAHFKYKLTTSWKPTAFDLEAYNALVEFVNEKQKQQLIDNQLFGKLYIYLYSQFTNYYKCSLVDDIPQKELNKILDKPLKAIVSDLVDNNKLIDIEHYISNNNSLDGFVEVSYNDIADNLRVMVNASLNQFNK
jgi:hypothetical protein